VNFPAPTEVVAAQVEAAEQLAVKVNWKPVGLAVYYLVYRSEQADSGFEYAGVSDGRILDADSYTCFYLDTDVEPGHTYYYKIRAGSGQANTSDFSKVSDGVSVSAL
jgi:hypothetical protein